MSAIVCQGLQSCLEPGFLEPPCAIIEKLAPPRSNVSQSIPIWSQKPNLSQEEKEHEKDNSRNENKNHANSNKFRHDDSEKPSNNDGELCWSFIQDFSNSSNTGQSGKEVEEEQVYVHPLAKRSSSTLSTQSLEMCTEGLGSETGSNSDEIMADLSSLSCEIQSKQGIQRSRSREYLTKKLERHGTFPPPLTLISGSDGIQLRPHREGGRLILKAVAFSHKSCFQAERSDGRLRLFSLSKDGYTTNCDEEISQYVEEEKSEELENENTAVEEQDFRVEATDSHARDEDDENHSSGEESMLLGSGGISEREIETDEYPRPSRCKEEGAGNRGIWEPFCVAIS